jgi:hypothetical protein
VGTPVLNFNEVELTAEIDIATLEGKGCVKVIAEQNHGATPFFSLCTSCMGRLSHLKVTLPLSLSHESAEVLLVDYSCPERSGDWAERAFPAEVGTGKLRVIRVGGRAEYHSAHAKNVSHARARGEVLINADADNLITKAYLERCREVFDDPLVQLAGPAPWSSGDPATGVWSLGRIR